MAAAAEVAAAPTINTLMALPPHYAFPKLIPPVVLVIREIKHHFIFHQGPKTHRTHVVVTPKNR